GHRHQPQRRRPVYRSRHAAVVQSSGPRARAGSQAQPRPGRNRRLSVDQGSRRQRRSVPGRTSGRPVLARVRGRPDPGCPGRTAVMKNGSPRVTRRGVQITLGLLWLADGALQFQPALLTPAVARQVIAPAGQGQPGFVSWPVPEAASLVARAPALAVVVFGLIELTLGAGLLHRRTARWALAASVG